VLKFKAQGEVRARKFIACLLIAVSTIVLCSYSVKKIWFREDDLGQIINGLVGVKRNVIDLFSHDERDNIVPINYRRSAPNMVSGFLRPIKHIFFTIIYKFFGLKAYAYFMFHITVHAVNAALIFYVLTFWVSLWLSVLGGLMFAFYPDVSWLAWLATLHNSLATMFLLLSVLLYQWYFFKPSKAWVIQVCYWLAGLLFLLSLLSRENGIFFPIWIAVGVMLYHYKKGQKLTILIKKVFEQTWIFFAMVLVYTFMRFFAFGLQTLPRTLHNILLRFPRLAQWFTTPASTSQAASVVTQVAQGAHAVTDAPSGLQQVFITLKHSVLDPMLTWSRLFFATNIQSTTFMLLLWAFFGILLYVAYRKNIRLFFFFIVGIGSFMWPGILAYPSARYINVVYPVLIAMFVVALHELDRLRANGQFIKTLFAAGVFMGCLSVGTGIYENVRMIKYAAHASTQLKDRYEPFFTENKFPKKSNFIVLSSPFVSDIQNIFQYFLDDLDVKVAYELFTTIAEKGSFSCFKDFRVKGVKSRVIPVEGGFRFISLEPNRCAWWLNFSDHPLKWHEHEKAYRWTSEQYRAQRTYQCSLGQLYIAKIKEHKYVTDMTLTIDKKWYDENTIFVMWDTYLGKYVQLNAEHLYKKTRKLLIS